MAGSPLVGRDIGALAFEPGRAVPDPQPGRWTLKLYPAASAEDARSQLVFLEAALAQYGEARLDAVVVGAEDWPLERVRSAGAGVSPEGVLLALVSPSGDVVRTWPRFSRPADLGLTLRRVLGAASRVAGARSLTLSAAGGTGPAVAR